MQKNTTSKKINLGKLKVNLLKNQEKSKLINSFPDLQNAENTVELYKNQHGNISRKNSDLLYLIASYSRFLGREFIRQPDIFNYLNNSKYVKTQKPLDKYLTETKELLADSENEHDFLSRLRNYKYRELARINYKDILTSSDCFIETMEELSDLASTIVQSLFDFYTQEYPHFRQNFVIIAMGKLGGRELNLSSDIDLIYLSNSTNSSDEIFKIAENLTTSSSSRSADGFLYRVDLGLRPGGGKSPIVVSIEGAIEHYFYWGDTWERAALIKARPVAGNIKLGQQFLKDLESFIYKRNLDYSSVEDIQSMKSKLDGLHKVNDVKLGKGGIREIEFFINAFQLIHGGKNKALREQGSLNTLDILENQQLIDKDTKTTLETSYIFLRKTEHYIQLVDEIQTHRVPEKSDELEKLAKRLGLEDKNEFTKVFKSVTDKVSKIYNSLFLEPSRKIEQVGNEFWQLADFLTEGHVTEEEALYKLHGLGFNNPSSAIDIIEVLINPKKGGLTQKGRTLSRKVIPALLRNVISSPNPDTSLRNVERFISGVGSRSSIYSVLSENPDICNVLSKLFSTSAYLSNFLIRHPEYLDLLTLKGGLKNYTSADEMFKDLEGNLSSATDFEHKLDVLRSFKHAETLKLCLRDLNNEVDPIYIGNYITILAEAELRAAFKLALDEMKTSKGKNDKMVVIGVGKLGGNEMGYNSDLDILFVYRGQNHEYYSKLGQKLISILSIPTGEGIAFKIDMGLRPSGRSGALVSSLESFRQYHESSAMLWERQSLIKARPVAGDIKLGKEVMRTIENFVYDKPLSDDFTLEIKYLRNRIEKELAKETEKRFNIKTGMGGLVDIDFIVQSLQLKYGQKKKTLRKTNTFETLLEFRRLNIINENEFNILSEGFKILKKIENLVRLMNDKSTSEIYISEFARVSDLIIGINGKELLDKYLRSRGQIRKIFNKYFK